MTPKVGRESWIRLEAQAQAKRLRQRGRRPGGLNNLSGDQEEVPITWAQ